MKRILLPTDFSENYIRAIQYALLVYKDIKCAFHLLHTFTPSVYQAEYLLSSPGQIGLGDVLRENSETQIEELKIDLLVMVQNKHTFLERLFIEPVIKKIGFHVTVPFMVLPYANSEV